MTTQPLTTDLPSAPVVSEADAQLASIAEQKQHAQAHLAELRAEQSQLAQRAHAIANRRMQMKQDAHTTKQHLDQAEVDAHLAATSTIALQTATAKLAEARKNAKDLLLRHRKDAKDLDADEKAMSERTATLSEQLAQEQSILDELVSKEGMIRDSRNRAFLALGEETYAAHIGRLDQAKAALDEATQRFIEANLLLAQEKEATYVALGQYGELREKAVHAYDLISDETTHILDAFAAFCDVLETDGHGLVWKIGQHSVAQELALGARPEWEMILSNPNERKRILGAKRNAAQQLKRVYLDKQ